MSILFAVTGVERSGTLWIRDLLNEDLNIQVEHEPLGNWDTRVYARARDGRLDTEHWIKCRWAWWAQQVSGDVADVSAFLRYAAGTIRDTWQVPVAAIVRDGRYVVRSLLKRGYYQETRWPAIETPEQIADDPQVCCAWLWADGYRALEAQGIPIWRLEDLNRDFGQVQDMAGYLGANVPRAAWERRAGRRVNKSIKTTEPPDWTAEQKAVFEAQAGDIMARFSYEM